MSLLAKLFGRQVLLQGFSESEKRQLLEIDHPRLHAEQRRREGKLKTIDMDATQDRLIKRLTDEELAQLVHIRELMRKADATSGTAAIQLYRQVLKLAPWDEISMMSIGVEYANARDFGKAIRWLEKAAKANPGNVRVKRNLEGVRAAAQS
jgi:tetratricopeptide (TPR) repeat protein